MSRNIKYKDLYSFSTTPSVCVLENPVSKKALIFASDNPCLYVSNLISRLTTKKHGNQELYKDRRKLKLTVLETLSTRHLPDHILSQFFKWGESYWYNHYSRNGYSFYSAYKPVSMILHIKVDYRYGVLVELRNTGGKGFVVGVFSTMQEAEAWIDEFYPDLVNINPLFSTNMETINYYRDKVNVR